SLAGFCAVANVDGLGAAFSGTAPLDVEQRRRGDQVAQLAVAVAARVEVGTLLADDRANRTEAGPAFVVRGRLHRIAEQVDQRGILLQLRGRAGFFGRGFVGFAGEILDVHELVARGDERL